MILLIYELLYHGLAALRRSWVISAASVLTALFLGAKLSSASVLVQVYRPRFSVERLLDNWRLLLRVVLWRRPISAGAVILLCLAPLVIAVGAQILLIDDPFEADDWTPSSLIQLYYHDATLEIERTRQTGRRDSNPATKPDIVFAYRNGRTIEVPQGL